MRKSIAGLGGSLTALATPFRDGTLDGDALVVLCERQIERGTAALIVCGSTGEAAALSQHEYARAVSIVVEAAADRGPGLAGCPAMATAAAMAFGVAAAAAGADALLCAAPPYVKPTSEGIIAHVGAIAVVAKLPIVLYDVPGRTARGIGDELVARLYEQGLIVGIKDATAELSRPPRLGALCGDGFVQWSGDDATAPAYRAMGGSGCVSVTANVAPALCAALHRAWDNAELGRFATLRELLDPLHAALFAESNPIPLKAALASLGLCTGQLRLPLTRATPATQERLLRVMGPIIQAEEYCAGSDPFALAS